MFKSMVCISVFLNALLLKHFSVTDGDSDISNITERIF